MTSAVIQGLDRVIARARADLAETLNRADSQRRTIADLEIVRADLLQKHELPDVLTRRQIADLIGRTTETVRKIIRAGLIADPVAVVVVGPKREAGYPLEWCRRIFPTLPTQASLAPILAGHPTTCDSPTKERQAEAPTE